MASADFSSNCTPGGCVGDDEAVEDVEGVGDSDEAAEDVEEVGCEDSADDDEVSSPHPHKIIRGINKKTATMRFILNIGLPSHEFALILLGPEK